MPIGSIHLHRIRAARIVCRERGIVPLRATEGRRRERSNYHYARFVRAEDT